MALDADDPFSEDHPRVISATDDPGPEDDHTDITYHPYNETPSRRVYRGERRLPTAVMRKKVNAEAKIPDTCCITGEKNICGTVQYAHGLDRNLNYNRPHLMTSLEYHWGYPRPDSLSLDTRRNIRPVNPTLHITGDQGAYGSLPRLNALKTIYVGAKKQRNLPLNQREKYFKLWTPPNGEKRWLYDLLMFRFRPDAAPTIVNKSYSNGQSTTTYHEFSYQKICCELYMHPVFAIVDLWLKLGKYKPQPFWTRSEKLRMDYVRKIMRVWRKAPREEWLKLNPSIHKLFVPASLSPSEAGDLDGDRDNDAPASTPTKKPKQRSSKAAKGKAKLTVKELSRENPSSFAAQGKSAPERGAAMEAGPSNNHHALTLDVLPEEDDVDPRPAKRRRKDAHLALGAGPSHTRKLNVLPDRTDADRPRIKDKMKGKQKSAHPAQKNEPERPSGSEAGPSNLARRSKRKNTYSLDVCS